VNQIQASIDPNNGNIVIHAGGHILFGMAPKDALAFIGGLAGLVAGHPALNTELEPKIVIAGTLPPMLQERKNGR
jgi:hypothetical protein